MSISELIFPSDKSKALSDFSTSFKKRYESKEEAQTDLRAGIKKLRKLHEKLYAYDRYALLIIFQAMDAAGKDGTIKHVMSGINPQGCQVKSFKAPSREALNHDYLWRCNRFLPERGKIGIFNRSYYEEVLVVRVHSENLLGNQHLPDMPADPKNNKEFWKQRYDDINCYERYLTNNGTVILKFFLHVSKEEQKQRFLARIDDPDKNWKISVNDFTERKYWNEYMHAYEKMLRHTSTEYAPWYVIPADNKWNMRAAVCETIVNKMKALDLRFPEVTEHQKVEIEKARELLLQEE